MLIEIELNITLKIDHNLTETDLDNINVRFALEEQIQRQELKDSGWRFDTNNSMAIYFYKTGKMTGTSYVKTPLRSSAIINIRNDDKYCYFWSLLAHLHPIADSRNGHAIRVSKYRRYLKDLNFQDFDFSNEFKCSDVHKFEKLYNLSINYTTFIPS